MKLLSLLALAVPITAHTVFTTLWVDGASKGDGMGVRMRKDGPTATFPLKPEDPSSACGYDGDKANPRIVPVPDGSVLSFEFRSWANDRSKGSIDPSHKGPCSVYLKKVGRANKDGNASGGGWFKVFEEGYDEDLKMWCTSKLGGKGNPGLYESMLSVRLPKGLQGGHYLARAELLGLHSAPDGNPQFYTGCAQIFIRSEGNKVPKDTVSIPGHVKAKDASVTYNIYKQPLPLPYPMPGPRVAELVPGKKDLTKQEHGLEPAGCVMSMAGFCAFEVADYNDEKGCWDAGNKCWEQADKCWAYAKTLPTTGDPWCVSWGNHCQAIADNCGAKNFKGPPNKGKNLTPEPPKKQVVMAKGSV